MDSDEAALEAFVETVVLKYLRTCRTSPTREDDIRWTRCCCCVFAVLAGAETFVDIARLVARSSISSPVPAIS